MQTLSTLPDNFECRDHHKSHASEIRVHPSGRWLYVANRGHDSIAVYAVACAGEPSHAGDSVDSVTAFDARAGDGTLTCVQICSTLGAFPRNFNFDATGRWLVVGNQNDNELRVRHPVPSESLSRTRPRTSQKQRVVVRLRWKEPTVVMRRRECVLWITS